jgi:hypothetical protein
MFASEALALRRDAGVDDDRLGFLYGLWLCLGSGEIVELTWIIEDTVLELQTLHQLYPFRGLCVAFFVF